LEPWPGKANGAVRKKLELMRAEVERGEPLPVAAARSGLFPGRFIHLFEMGERGGNLLPVLDEITSSSIDACERVVNWISLVAIPTTVVAVGVAVAMLGISVFSFLTEIMSGCLRGGP